MDWTSKLIAVAISQVMPPMAMLGKSKYKDITHDIDEMIDSILVKTTSPTGEWKVTFQRLLVTKCFHICFLEHKVYLACKSCNEVLSARKGSGRRKKKLQFNESLINDLFILNEKFSRNLGRCYEFRFTEKLTRLGLVYVVFTTTKHMSLYIYLHTPGQFASIDEKGL